MFIAGGGVVRGEKFNPVFRMGNSYYIPAGSVPYSLGPRIPSHRRFINPHGWHSADLLLVPCLIDDRIVGQISVDDPRDGAKPTPESLRALEELARVAAIALSQARQRESLSQRHRLFSFLTENAMTGVFIVQDGRIRYANDRAIELFGYSPRSSSRSSRGGNSSIPTIVLPSARRATGSSPANWRRAGSERTGGSSG